uniref:Uncharacterized protein n=1 Tax=Pan troglodytes TaxID=9598 RepID=G2HI99_PANTR|nr:hypothetical protein [Pan troglodytes]
MCFAGSMINTMNRYTLLLRDLRNVCPIIYLNILYAEGRNCLFLKLEH